ncbi:unnamed protein product [Adineta steineri]|uniref:G-protein coupled receptors family 1 profile domain-containing protein n=2 Tax=Adineta steineri TaxID=433720 RepID=A0A819ATF6_9BILA|nr:unnamed protein product [Adineta steineri]CAF3785052.1 unnamed protein product [Adineta steineri]CAF3802866.1 unnamed protein product [Adineta steineri]
MVIHFLQLNGISPATGTYCKTWMYVEFTLEAVTNYLVAVMSIQRHTLVFRPNLFIIRFKRYLLYYLPLLCCIIYPVTFYMGAVVFYPCDPAQWNFTLNMCGDTICFLSGSEVLATYDWIVNSGLPIILIMLANLVLIIRVVKQKSRRQKTVSWSKQRRMTLQLVSISSLYLLTWLPTIITGIMQQIIPSNYLYGIQEDFISDLTYLNCLLMPWMSLGLLPDFHKWMLKRFKHVTTRQNTIRPTA